MKSDSIHSYKDLYVWQKSMDLCTRIYKLTDLFPKSELYGLASQMRRSSVSIPSNIAEGRHRSSKKYFTHFLFIAYASGAELETQIELAKRLHFARTEEFKESDALLLETMKMLNKMLSTLKANS